MALKLYKPTTPSMRQLVLVDSIQRSPAGKADYRWAKTVVEAAPGPVD